MFDSLSDHGVIAAALIAPASAELIAALSGIDITTVSASAQVDLLAGWARQAAWIESRQQPLLVVVGDTAAAACLDGSDGFKGPDVADRAAHCEIALTLRIAESTAAGKLEVARQLGGRLSAVAAALAAGDISYWQANAIYEATCGLTDAKTAIVVGRVLPKARKQTLSALRRALRRAVLAVEPKTAAERAAAAVADRTLDWWPLADGMAEMRYIAAAADVLAVFHAADSHAQHHAGARNPDGSKTPIAARRADALRDLVLGTTTTCTCTSGSGGSGGSGTSTSCRAGGMRVRAGRPAVQVTIDLPTLLGLADNPAELAGYGPIPAPIARTLAADGVWRRLIHEPLSGALLDLGHTAYRPNAALARYIQARDATCCFPQCTRAARRCDIDHTRRYQPHHPGGGRTDRNNLGALCAHHHVLKHRAGWTVQRHPITEVPVWTSPTGHTYTADHHDQRSPQAAAEPDDDTEYDHHPVILLGDHIDPPHLILPNPSDHLPTPDEPENDGWDDHEPAGDQ